jgi:hypothetical protein
MEKIRAAVIGGSESGKTFLVMGFSRGLWQARGLRSLVFDPWRGENNWGAHAWVSHDFDRWKAAVMGTRNCVVIWDEASANGGRDRENVGLFSEIRHRHPVLFCVGHAYSVILPIMRINLTDLFIAAADEIDAKEWGRVMRDPQIAEACLLPQYAFLHKRAFQPVRVLRYSKEQVAAGVLP